jgi:aminoglycoside phosphotransferase (APT) family kinase protein
MAPADKAAWKVVSPPAVLPVATAEALLTGWRDARPVVSVEPLEGGIMNWNYGIRFRGSAERVVLRFYDRAPASCAKEVRLLSLVRADVPVPQVLHAEIHGAKGFPPFCVLEFIDGISLRTLRGLGNTRGVAESSYDAGRLLARLARHRFETSGTLSPELVVHDSLFAHKSAPEIVEYFATYPTFRQRIDASLLARILHFAKANSEPLAVDSAISLVHGDFNSPNILVREVGGSWRVAAILDWEFAFAGSPLCDVGNMLRYERPGESRYEPHFSLGLVDGGWTAPEDWFLRARLADLPALCELLARDGVPEQVVDELRDLIEETLTQAPTYPRP